MLFPVCSAWLGIFSRSKTMLNALPADVPPPKPSKEMEVLVPMLAYTPVPRRNRIQCSEIPRLLNSGCLSPDIT
eukprot:3390124-Karenia_brevis.AAC.1